MKRKKTEINFHKFKNYRYYLNIVEIQKKETIRQKNIFYMVVLGISK